MSALCPDCGSPDVVDTDNGDVCTACGLVLTQPRMVAAPARMHDDSEDGPSRAAGAPPPPTPDAKVATRRILALQRKTWKREGARNKWRALMRDVGEAASLPGQIIRTAEAIYEDATSRADWKHRKHDNHMGVLVACLFHACNIARAHRSPFELADAAGVPIQNARKMVKVTQAAADRAARLESSRSGGTDVAVEVIPRFVGRLDIDLSANEVTAVVRTARRAYYAIRSRVDNHRPDTVSAGVISLALRLNNVPALEHDVAAACKVSLNTVRSMHTRFAELYAELCPGANPDAPPPVTTTTTTTT